jgi:hypothetical protein
MKLQPYWVAITITISIAFGIGFTAHAQPQEVDELPNGNLLIEDFEETEIGELPKRWYNQKGTGQPSTYVAEERAAYEYEVQAEGNNKFLRFDGIHGKHLNFPTVEVKNINLDTHPILSWRWRVFQIPEGGNERNRNKIDVAASIYVVFRIKEVLFKKIPESIMYTWSSTLDVGTELSQFFGNKKTIVVETGTEATGQWKTFQRNIAEDYQRLFGNPPPDKPVAILILSDGNDTDSRVIADYDDIILMRQKLDPKLSH